MTYSVGNLVAASDYNALLTTLASVYEVGSGDAGYGQTQYSLASVAAGGKITSAQWTELRNALAVCRQSQTGSVPSLVPPTTVLEAGDKVTAHESVAPTSNAHDLDSEVTAAYMNRFVANSIAVGSLSGTTGATRSGTWGGGATDGIQLVFDVTWSSTDEARYFFNSGGQIRVNLSQPGATAQDTNWNNALVNRVGQIQIMAHSTTMLGSLGSSAALGYYEATGSAQTIFNNVGVGTAPYAVNSLRLQYQALGSAANGGPGNGLRLTIRLTDDHANSFSDVVSSGTLATFSFAKNSFLANPSIITPTGAINAAWIVV